jgi:hypothetical protein
MLRQSPDFLEPGAPAFEKPGEQRRCKTAFGD